ncbi:MAG: phosphotransferase [Deltaproteobacteria bacterium]|nr:phosphotransferase [Deltaproteobacteria bacterium]MBW2051626.1 phosphotransferase [Deltaproteobacteria bacterium]MBW2141270.1 phosphotransferase [Deltaproteobacteria bacterium]MBW2323426.1 phosphotransferase [Deltaproteobacteria bacterium]
MTDRMNDQETARNVAELAFELGPLLEIRHLPQGRVNLTYLVRTNKESFILQRLHPVLGNDGAVIQNVVTVTEILADKGVRVPRVLSSKAGAWWVEKSGLWRLMTFLPGQPPDTRSVKIGVEAAQLLGQFHRALAEEPLSLISLPPADHNRDEPASPRIWYEIISRYEGNPKIEQAFSVLEEGRSLASRLPTFTATTQTVLHGDPKLENFLFDEYELASGLIDLDIVRYGSLLWELADALRSWSVIRGPEDRAGLSQDIFIEAVRSYRKHGLDLTPEEWRQLPAATRAMALDLARRYLTDYFEEEYFAWDKDQYPSLAEQNLIRGASLVSLAGDLEKVEKTLLDQIRA